MLELWIFITMLCSGVTAHIVETQITLFQQIAFRQSVFQNKRLDCGFNMRLRRFLQRIKHFPQAEFRVNKYMMNNNSCHINIEQQLFLHLGIVQTAPEQPMDNGMQSY